MCQITSSQSTEEIYVGGAPQSSGFKLPLFEGVLNESDADFTVVKTLSTFTQLLFWLKKLKDICPLKDKFEDTLYCFDTKL